MEIWCWNKITIFDTLNVIFERIINSNRYIVKKNCKTCNVLLERERNKYFNKCIRIESVGLYRTITTNHKTTMVHLHIIQYTDQLSNYLMWHVSIDEDSYVLLILIYVLFALFQFFWFVWLLRFFQLINNYD